LTLIGTASFLLAPPWRIQRAWAQAGERALAFIKSTTDQLAAVASSANSVPEKRRRLRAILDATVDHDEIARYCLGRFWRIATPDQQKQYMALFYDLLAAEITGHLGEYGGVRITMGLARTFEDTEIVTTMVERPNAPVMRVDWVVSTTTGTPQIVDLIAEGTSMRITQASDFTSYLAHHEYNIQGLIELMRQKSEQNG
jgi:phospholipid transport system substrate-binding protein